MEKLDYCKLRVEFANILSNISRKEIKEWIEFDNKRQKDENKYSIKSN